MNRESISDTPKQGDLSQRNRSNVNATDNTAINFANRMNAHTASGSFMPANFGAETMDSSGLADTKVAYPGTVANNIFKFGADATAGTSSAGVTGANPNKKTNQKTRFRQKAI